ncbi:MAG: hypothetical protein V2A76_00360 [Planctomycetota bacterium]
MIITILQGFSVLAAAIALQPILDSLMWSSAGRFPFFLLFTGLGIAFGRPTEERAPGRWLVFPRLFALGFLFFTCVTLLLSPKFQHGPLDGRLGLITALVLIGLSGICAGQMLRPLILFVGGRRTQRLHLWNGALTGAALAACSVGVIEIGRTTSMVVFLMTMTGALALMSSRTARALDMPVPDWESWRRGLTTTVGVVLLGVGFSALGPAFFQRAPALTELTHQFSAALPPLVLFAAAPWISSVSSPRLKRAGIRFGGISLLAAAGVCSVDFLGRAESIQDQLGRLFPPSLPFWMEIGLLSLALFGVPALLLGLGLAVLPRLYGGLQFGDKILWQIPEEERKAPVGGAFRVGMFLVGASAGASLMASELFSGSPNGRLEWSYGCLLVGGLLLVVFDPCAGIGRKLMTLMTAGGIAVATAFLCF